MHRKIWYVAGLLLIVLLSACAAQKASSQEPPQALLSDGVHIAQPTMAAQLNIPRHTTKTLSPIKSTHMPTATPDATAAPSPAPSIPPPSGPLYIPITGIGSAPYGSPPALTSEEIQLTQQLFALINSDRAVRGLYPFVWNATLSGGARLHSWNMIHCGFSHTCPDGLSQCQRIANEGFAGYTDCGENIAEAGPYPTPWGGASSIQESMINEPPTGWHRIHLTSTTLHKVGVGVVVDPSTGWIWFTEDLVS